MEQVLHIRREWIMEMHIRSRYRMTEFKAAGMQCLPLHLAGSRIVQKIPDQRMPRVEHVYADLVRSSGIQPDLKK